MAQGRADGGDGDAVFDQVGGKGVPKIMEPELWHAGLQSQSDKSFCQDVGRFEGAVVPAAYEAGIDHLLGAYTFLHVLVPQGKDQILHPLGDDQLPAITLIRFELIDDVPPHTGHVMIQAIIFHDVSDLTNRGEHVPSEIEILELEPQHLSPSQAEVDAQQHLQVDAVLLSELQKSLHLVWRNELPTGPLDTGQLHILAGVLRYDFIDHRLLECAPEGGVREMDAGRRQALLLHPSDQFLHIIAVDHVQLPAAQHGIDIQADVHLRTAERGYGHVKVVFAPQPSIQIYR